MPETRIYSYSAKIADTLDSIHGVGYGLTHTQLDAVRKARDLLRSNESQRVLSLILDRLDNDEWVPTEYKDMARECIKDSCFGPNSEDDRWRWLLADSEIAHRLWMVSMPGEKPTEALHRIVNRSNATKSELPHG